MRLLHGIRNKWPGRPAMQNLQEQLFEVGVILDEIRDLLAQMTTTEQEEAP